MLRTIIVLSLFCCVTAFAQWTEPVLVDSIQDTLGINSPGKEWCPYITADGQTMYFAARRRDGNDDIYVAHLNNDNWGNAVLLPFCIRNVDERNPTVNATNDTLYFISYSGGWDIWWCFRTGQADTSWSEPQRMPEPINSEGIEFSVWCTPDNQRLLFSSWRISANGEDIYECRRDPNTETGWSVPSILPGRICFGRPESYPSMGFDTTEIFFREGIFGQIAVSHLTDSGWTVGEPLSNMINRGTQETTPCITPDGRRLYLSSRYGEPAPAGDIWYSERPSAVPRSTRQPRDQGIRIEVFPNPATEEFIIQTEGGIRQITLFDILGRVIAERKLDGTPGVTLWKLPLQSMRLPSGSYYIVGQNAEKTSITSLQILK